MEPIMAHRKTRRTYDSTGRVAQAQRARLAMLDGAESLLLANGYHATTVAAIARAVGVSVETLYKSFGGKPGLVRAIRERRLGGSGPVHAEQRSERVRADSTDGHALVAQWGRLTAEVAPLVAPILLLVRDAATADPELRTLQDELDADRRRRMRANAKHLHDAGYLRDGISLAHATDVLWTFSAPEFFELLVLRRGWAVVRFGAFVGDSIAAALLRPI
jgi:AcrR family transcriptional regulator